MANAIPDETTILIRRLRHLEKLNLDLLEATSLALQKIMVYAEKNDILLDGEDTLRQLLKSAVDTYDEMIYFPENQKYSSDERKHLYDSDEEVTEPHELLKNVITLIGKKEKRRIGVEMLLSKGYREVRNKIEHEAFQWKPTKKENMMVVNHLIIMAKELFPSN